MAPLSTIKLSKSPGTSWGFRLQGGKDFATPLCIQKVNVGSVAAQAGLQAGDVIVTIAGVDAFTLRHKEAQDTIVRAGNSFDVVIQRGSQVWKPTITALPEVKTLSDGVPVATKTSLAATQKPFKPIGSRHNVSAAPFNEGLVLPAYNTPINIYSDDSIAETLSAQAEVLGKTGVMGINFKKYAREEKIRTDSPTYKLLHGDEEPERRSRPPLLPVNDDDDGQQATPPAQGYPSGVSAVSAPVTNSAGPQEQLRPGENTCFVCERLVVGVFVRVKGKNLHAECFKCSTCGSSLKNVGYYNINDKLYCDTHAKQAARVNPPAPNMEPVIVPPGSSAPFGAVTAQQAGRMKVPSAFQQNAAPAPSHAPVPAPFKAPPPGGVRILPVQTTNAPTPFKPEPEPPAPVLQEVQEPAPEPVTEPFYEYEPEVSSEPLAVEELTKQEVEEAPYPLPPIQFESPPLQEETYSLPLQEPVPVQNGLPDELAVPDSQPVVESPPCNADEIPKPGVPEEPAILLPEGPVNDAAMPAPTVDSQVSEPVISPQPEPVVSPVPIASPQPEPAVVPQPEPVIAPQQPIPVASPQPEPVLSPQPEPVIAAIPQPTVVEKPVPTQEAPKPVGNPAPVFKPAGPDVTFKPVAPVYNPVDNPVFKPVAPEPVYKPIEPPFKFSEPSVFKPVEPSAVFAPSATSQVKQQVSSSSSSFSSQFRSEETQYFSSSSSVSSSLTQKTAIGSGSAIREPPAPVNPAPVQRAPVSAPAPPKSFAPAPAPAPAPVPVAAAPRPAPSFGTGANPQGFGAPARDVNVRSHIPKKDQQTVVQWPPRNFLPEEVSEPAPLWPEKKKPRTTKPYSKPVSSSPKATPTTPKSPSTKLYSAAHKTASQFQGAKPLPVTKAKNLAQPSAFFKVKSPTHPSWRTSKLTKRSKASPRKSPAKPTLRLYSERFPNPAPSYILKFSSITEESELYNVTADGTGQGFGGSSPGVDPSKSGSGASGSDGGSQRQGRAPDPLASRPRVKTNISPIRSRPINEPMPAVDFNTRPDAKGLFEASLRKYASSFLASLSPSPPPKPQKSAPATKSLSAKGFKVVNPPSFKPSTKMASPKVKIELPPLTPVESITRIMVDIDSLNIVEGMVSA